MRTPTPPADGWRERKKRLTRDELQRTAIEMFRARGYEDVTVEEIAAAAAVSPRTFYRYFPAKEDLVLGSLDELTDGIVAALAARPPDEPVLDSVRAAAIEVARAVQRLPQPPEPTQDLPVASSMHQLLGEVLAGLPQPNRQAT